MNEKKRIAVVGLGEVGKPLANVLGEAYDVVGIDLPHPPLEEIGPVEVVHLCLPFEIADFVGEAECYVDGLQPDLVVLDSTVGVGTTRKIFEATGVPIAHSPIRGKHVRMQEELLQYTKFIGAVDDATAALAEAHFSAAGFETEVLSSPETTELAKLTETTYFGLLIAWAQEVERYCDKVELDYDEVTAIFEEVGYLPRVQFFPGIIGRHCVMPNIEILRDLEDSSFLQAIETSNALKIERETLREPS